MMYCPKCRQTFGEGNFFCPYCSDDNGNGIRLQPVAPSIKEEEYGSPINMGDHVGDFSYNVSKDDHSVRNNYYTTNVEAAKSAEQLTQENETRFLQAVQQRLADGMLDQRELSELNQLAFVCQLTPQRAQEIIELVRRNSTIHVKSQASQYIEENTIQEVYDAISRNSPEVLAPRLPALKQLAAASMSSDIQYCYYMLLASLAPESITIEFLNVRTDNYWQLFWVCVAYMKMGQPEKASALFPRLGVFGNPQGDVALLVAIDNMAAYCRQCNQTYYMEQAAGNLGKAVQLGLSGQLNVVWHALQEIMNGTSASDSRYTFYIRNTFKEFYIPKVPAIPQIPDAAMIQVPPVPNEVKFDAQSVQLEQMRGFNPLKAMEQLNNASMPPLNVPGVQPLNVPPVPGGAFTPFQTDDKQY